MTTTCERLDALLLEGDEASMMLARTHAAECAACAPSVEAWDSISSTASGMKESWTNDTFLPRALKAIERDRRPAAPNRFWQIAAILLFTITLGGTVVWVLSTRAREAEFDRAILRISAIQEVERTERAHLAAIAQLERVAQPKLQDTSSPLMVSYNEKLMLLDDAIAECEKAIEHNQQNAHLRRQLLSMLDDKRATLHDVLREDTHVPSN
jgi:hypothetical protein